MKSKNCLIVFRNKKLNIFDGAKSVIDNFSGLGYYFDKIEYIAYDSSDEIVRALKEAREFYENVIIYCPSGMANTLKNYISYLYTAEFNELGILKSNTDNVFLLFSDRDNRLQYGDIKNILDNKYGVKFDRAFIKVVGAPVSVINAAIEKAREVCPEIGFNVSDKYGDCRIETIYSSNTPKMLHDEVVRILVAELNDYLYAMEDIPLAERLFQLLKLRRMKISVAESFTGGGIGKRLVEISGISEVFEEGLNTYSNEAKMYRLGVNELTLKHYGAVSEQTAHEMAEGLLKRGNCDIVITSTGIAGPKSDNTSKPVGLCYLAIGTHEKVAVYQYNLKGDRESITKTAINLALFLAYKTLK